LISCGAVFAGSMLLDRCSKIIKKIVQEIVKKIVQKIVKKIVQKIVQKIARKIVKRLLGEMGKPVVETNLGNNCGDSIITRRSCFSITVHVKR
jgi:ABC-type siderophore export system fused ATPase/permease subunit